VQIHHQHRRKVTDIDLLVMKGKFVREGNYPTSTEGKVLNSTSLMVESTDKVICHIGIIKRRVARDTGLIPMQRDCTDQCHLVTHRDVTNFKKDAEINHLSLKLGHVSHQALMMWRKIKE
jgi:hypothetical protein